jgi:hypothetical protein
VVQFESRPSELFRDRNQSEMIPSYWCQERSLSYLFFVIGKWFVSLFLQICFKQVWGAGDDIVPGSFTNCGHFTCQSCFVNSEECPVCQAPNNGSLISEFGSCFLDPNDFDSIADPVQHLFQGKIMMHSLRII